jgi:prepilin-type N-terminal cleavage/methylation domain-containing protein
MIVLPISKSTETSSVRGFSLLELLVVMTILVTVTGIIMSVMFQMAMSQGTVSNRTEMHASVRSATELLQQEVGQAGRVAVPTSLTPTAPVTMSAAVAGDGASHTIAVSSTAGLFPGELVLIGPETTGTSIGTIEPLFVTNLSSTAITGIWQDPHAATEAVTVLGTFPGGIIPPATDANCLGGGGPPQACKWFTISGSAPAATAVNPVTAAQASTGYILKLFGDINGDGKMVYIEYWCKNCDTAKPSAPTNLYRNVITLPAAGTGPTTATKPAVTNSQILLPNVICNGYNSIADTCPGTPLTPFAYQVKGVGNDTFIVDVAVTLTVMTHNKDSKTGKYQYETKALLNVSPRNLFEAWRMAGQGVPSRLQAVPEAVVTLAGLATN